MLNCTCAAGTRRESRRARRPLRGGVSPPPRSSLLPAGSAGVAVRILHAIQSFLTAENNRGMRELDQTMTSLQTIRIIRKIAMKYDHPFRRSQTDPRARVTTVAKSHVCAADQPEKSGGEALVIRCVLRESHGLLQRLRQTVSTKQTPCLTLSARTCNAGAILPKRKWRLVRLSRAQ